MAVAALAAVAAAADTATAAVQYCCRGTHGSTPVARTVASAASAQRLCRERSPGLAIAENLEHLGCPKICLRPKATCKRKLRLGEELGQETTINANKAKPNKLGSYLSYPTGQLPYIWGKTFELLLLRS